MAADLSGRMKKRAGLARAMALDPDILPFIGRNRIEARSRFVHRQDVGVKVALFLDTAALQFADQPRQQATH